MQEQAEYARGFKNQRTELQIDALSIQGTLPSWLEGTLFRTTPSVFDLEKQQLKHWFDGFAMLHKFSIKHGQVNYRSRLLESTSYREAKEAGTLQHGAFGSDPCRTIFQKVSSVFNPPDPTDNGNVNIIRFGDQLAAVTETTRQNLFHSDTLETIGLYEYEDDTPGSVSVAHPHYDRAGNLISYVTDFGRPSKYTVYQQAPGSKRRKEIAVIETDQPAYMHSFGMTEHYVILVEFPLVVNPLRLLLFNKPFIENYRWKPELGTRFQVIDRFSGEHVSSIECDPCFAFHHVNAFEEGDKVIVDMVAYPDSSIIEELYLDRLRAAGHSIATAHLLRSELDLERNEVSNEHMLSDAAIELPRIHPEWLRQPYRYCYGGSNQHPGNFIDSIVKIDISDGSFQIWEEKNSYPGEPVFVPAPHAEQEDEGVLLSVVYHPPSDKSFLLILDAAELKEIARAVVPERIPFGFHGQFYSLPTQDL